MISIFGRHSRVALLLLWLQAIPTTMSWMISSSRSSSWMPMMASTRSSDSVYWDREVTAEVVGATGRMGSWWYLQLQRERSGTILPVPRGVVPGSMSSKGTPIYVLTPSTSWKDVYDSTLPNRRDDLVWIGNGRLHDWQRTGTVVIPHFGILKVGQASPTLSKTSKPPPSYCYGIHARAARDVLWNALSSQNEQDKTAIAEICDSWEIMKRHALLKVLWSSCLWLLCHSTDGTNKGQSPLTVAQVHQQRQTELNGLVEELSPVLNHILKTEGNEDDSLCEPASLLEYLETYSMSMPSAIPSKALALSELQHRNGLWWAWRDAFPQPVHERLLEQVPQTDGDGSFLEALKQGCNSQESPNGKDSNTANKIDFYRMDEFHLQVIGKTNVNPRHVESAIVIGAGIVGSSVALALARRGCKVVVYDQQAKPSPRTGDRNGWGATSGASWAWLNANEKQPPAYQQLNHLAMFAWSQDPVLRVLPSWSGALVDLNNTTALPHSAGYPWEGPLTMERIRELEPQANFTLSSVRSNRSGSVFYFPAEGHVDPVLAVQTLRNEAEGLGVHFRCGVRVDNLLRENGRVVGIQHGEELHTADIIFVAAGIGSGTKELGGLPLSSTSSNCLPGKVAFAEPLSVTSNRLQRILVDTKRKTHILQREDGALVAGGGTLEVGGSTSLGGRDAIELKGSDIISAARTLAPLAVEKSVYIGSEKAIRPIPTDGLPSVGELEPGLYSVVTHSGMTLGPLLGGLAATEIMEGVSLDIVMPYHPRRFFSAARI